TNEPRPLYFLAELPRDARPQTVEQAREALKPTQVLLAEEHGITVQRQGDVFAIPSLLSTRHLARPSQRSALVPGGNPRATEGRSDAEYGGGPSARGKRRRDPDGGRRPEHVTIQLGDGKTWHLLVKNTVPATRVGSDWSGYRMVSRAWSLGGRVD